MLALLPCCVTVSLVAGLVLTSWRAIRRAGRMPPGPLRAGPICAMGEVVADGSEPVAKLTITQRRRRLRGWREIGRESTCRSFQIRTADGLVCVEATSELGIATPGLARVTTSATERVCTTAIAPGDVVMVQGRLVTGTGSGGAYRNDERWHLVTERSAALVSTVPADLDAKNTVRWWQRRGFFVIVTATVALAAPVSLLRDGASPSLVWLCTFLGVWPAAAAVGLIISFRDARGWWARGRLNEPDGALPAPQLQRRRR